MKVFVIAMASEAQPLLAHLENKTESLVCDKPVYYGTLCGEAVGIIVCGVGKVNAACGVMYAVCCMQATVIVNIGVAGGLTNDLSIGRIYAVKSAVQYDFDLVSLNHTPMGTLNEFESPYLPLSVVNGYPAVVLGTGDRFNDSPVDYRLLTDKLGAKVRDMEGAAIVQAALHAHIPVYAFKCISDLAGSGSTTEQYLDNLRHCIDNLTKEIPALMEALNG